MIYSVLMPDAYRERDIFFFQKCRSGLSLSRVCLRFRFFLLFLATPTTSRTFFVILLNLQVCGEMKNLLINLVQTLPFLRPFFSSFRSVSFRIHFYLSHFILSLSFSR